MDNNWNNFIFRILGSFWDRIYSGHSLIRYISESLHKLLKRLHIIGAACVNSLYIMKDIDDHIHVSMVLVPIDDCIINRDTVNNYQMSGIVQKQTSVRTLSIPRKYVKNALTIQDSAIDPSCVWVMGVNMYEDGGYVTLIVPVSYAFNVTTKSYQSELKPVYILYPATEISGHVYNDNFGYLYGADLDHVDDTVRKELWKSHISGVTHKTVNTVLSASIGNDIADASFTVSDIWSEMGTFCILGSNSKVYRGKGLPRVTCGDAVVNGELLFSGVTAFNSKTMPSAIDMPFIEIKTAQGSAIAYNTITEPLTINGVYIPEYNNIEWANVAASYCKNNHISMLATNDPVNPLHHAMKTINPGSSCYYSIKGDVQCLTHTITAQMISDISINADFRITVPLVSSQVCPNVSCDANACISYTGEQSVIGVRTDSPKCLYI